MGRTHRVEHTLNSAHDGVSNAVDRTNDTIDNAGNGPITAEDTTNDLEQS